MISSSRLVAAALSAFVVLSFLGGCAADADTSARLSARGEAEYRTGSNIPRRGSAASDGVTRSTVDGLPSPERSASAAAR